MNERKDERVKEKKKYEQHYLQLVSAGLMQESRFQTFYMVPANSG